MSEQPEDRLYGVPFALTGLAHDTGELVIVPHDTPKSQLAQPGDIFTVRYPGGKICKAEFISVKPGKGPAGEYQEVCEIGPLKFATPESPT